MLFSTLKGSMELIADGDPEDARAILDPVLKRMMEAVHRHEWTVTQVMDDSIIALFMPVAHEHHAVQVGDAAWRCVACYSYSSEVFQTLSAQTAA